MLSEREALLVAGVAVLAVLAHVASHRVLAVCEAQAERLPPDVPLLEHISGNGGRW